MIAKGEVKSLKEKLEQMKLQMSKLQDRVRELEVDYLVDE